MAFKASDYLITPVDLYHGIVALFRLSPMGWVKLILVLGTFFVARHYGVGFIDAGFLTFLIATFAYNIEALVPLSFALASLLLIVLIMILGPHTEYVNETTWPEPIAVWVYYFLAIGVLKQMKDVLMDRREGDQKGKADTGDGIVEGEGEFIPRPNPASIPPVTLYFRAPASPASPQKAKATSTQSTQPATVSVPRTPPARVSPTTERTSAWSEPATTTPPTTRSKVHTARRETYGGKYIVEEKGNHISIRSKQKHKLKHEHSHHH